jgi:hypothetical protein
MSLPFHSRLIPSVGCSNTNQYYRWGPRGEIPSQWTFLVNTQGILSGDDKYSKQPRTQAGWPPAASICRHFCYLHNCMDVFLICRAAY